jgi:hypothetical protein
MGAGARRKCAEVGNPVDQAVLLSLCAAVAPHLLGVGGDG